METKTCSAEKKKQYCHSHLLHPFIPCLVGKVYMEHVSELLAFVEKYTICLVLYTESKPLLVKLG